MYFGFSAESPNALRNLLIAAVMLLSNSTTVSFGQSCLLDFLASNYLAAALHQHPQHWKGCSCNRMVRSP